MRSILVSLIGISTLVVYPLVMAANTNELASTLNAFNDHNGYHLNSHLSLEGGYMRLAKAEVKLDGVSGATDMNVAYADARASYPIGRVISFFAKVGYSAIFQSIGDQDTKLNQQLVDHSKTDFDPLAGAGVDCRVTPQLGLNLQYTAYIDPYDNDSTHNFPTTNMAVMGLSYNF